MFEIKSLLRQKIADRIQKKSTEKEYSAAIRLDTNKNLFGSALATNYHLRNKIFEKDFLEHLSGIKGVPASNIYLGNGNFELVSNLMSAFCEPHIDNILICTPTSDIFSEVADIQSVGVKKVLLINDYQLDIEGIAEAIDEQTKIIFLCSPNDPTANDIDRNDIEIILNNFDGIVVLDETYINYSRQRSFWYEIKEYPNLVILQNFDTAWGMAAANVAMAFADAEMIEILGATATPHGVSQASLEKIDLALYQIDQINQWIKDTVMLREFLARELQQMSIVRKVYPSSTNFLLVRFTTDASKVFDFLLQNNILVKNCHSIVLCENCLRISIGTLQEIETLIKTLKSL